MRNIGHVIAFVLIMGVQKWQIARKRFCIDKTGTCLAKSITCVGK